MLSHSPYRELGSVSRNISWRNVDIQERQAAQPKVTPSVTLGSPHSRRRNLKEQGRDGSKELRDGSKELREVATGGTDAAYTSGEDIHFHSTQVSLLWKQNRSIGSTFPVLPPFLSPSKFSKVVLFTEKLLLKPQPVSALWSRNEKEICHPSPQISVLEVEKHQGQG